MRILQVVHGFPPDAWAGTELVTYFLSQTLAARGHQVSILTRIEDPTAEDFSLREEREGDLTVFRVVNNHRQVTTFRLFYDNPFYDDLFRHLLERLHPDVVHFQHIGHFSASLLPLAASLGCPTVLSLHDFFFSCQRIHLIDGEGKLCPGPERGQRCIPCLKGAASSDDVFHRFACMEEALRAADVVLTPSVFLQERMQSYFPSIQERLRIVPLGVKPMQAQARQRQPGERFRLLYVGLLFPPKGAHVLIEALKGLSTDTFEVSIYGAVLPDWQPYVDRLRENARDLPVHFFGDYAHDQLGAILSTHDVLVMPMICEETFSIVTREAMLAGLPVVAARRGALPAVVEDDVNGLLFEPENASDLRRCLVRLLTEPDLLPRLRPTALQVKTVDVYAAEMEHVYAAVGKKDEAIPANDFFAPSLSLRRGGDSQATATRTLLALDPVSQMPLRLGLSDGSEIHNLRRTMSSPATVSVLIPTKNGARYLDEVLAHIKNQQGDFRLCEIIAVDSGSRDKTLSILHRHDVTVIEIPAHEFGHGKTRNLLAAQARSEFLVFLTQDATPIHDQWLQSLLAPLRADPLVAGAYSRQIPRPNCHPMEWHRIVEYELHGRLESRIHSAVDNPQDYEQNPWLYRFFANTSAVVRRSVWERMPFPDVEFAEDQAWAAGIIKAGYKTAYAAGSVVYHSHGYGSWVNFCRHFEHAVAMHKLFAVASQRTLQECIPAALRVAKADLIFWRQQTGQSRARILGRWGLPAVSWHVAANLGTWLGERAYHLPQKLVHVLSLQEQVKRS